VTRGTLATIVGLAALREVSAPAVIVVGAVAAPGFLEAGR
jgi:uroporphyrin-III C-methyltransferase / precorrin-2 dehydrogenase / sirohydrochlorin ferrochelatase